MQGVNSVRDSVAAPQNIEIPFSHLATLLNHHSKLLNDQLQSKMADLYKEVTGEVTKLREEVGSLKENIIILNSKVKSISRSRKKLPKDLSVSPTCCNHHEYSLMQKRVHTLATWEPTIPV